MKLLRGYKLNTNAKASDMRLKIKGWTRRRCRDKIIEEAIGKKQEVSIFDDAAIPHL